jgi:hypothetical protein
MQGLKPCSFCNEMTHTERKCPELVAPLREEGIQKPSGGRPHGGDDEEDTVKTLFARINKEFNICI